MKSAVKKLFAVLLGVLLSAIAFCGCKWNKNSILRDYETEKYGKYYTFKATIREIRQLPNTDTELDRYYQFDIDYEFFEQHYGNDETTTSDGQKKWELDYRYLNRFEYDLIRANYNIIKENGGFELLVIGAEVMITANSAYYGPGWEFPILGLSVGDTTYLEFETGKENFLNYVRAGFQNPK